MLRTRARWSWTCWSSPPDRSGNASAEGSVSATPLPLRSGGELLRDEAYLAQAAGAEAPTGVDLSGEWTRKPVAPTDSLPVVWRSYREAELGGEVNLVWSQWTAPQPYAVFEDRAVDGFTRNLEFQYRALDHSNVIVAESDAFIEPTPNAPLVEVRRRLRASFADSFPDWDPSVHRSTTVGRHTGDDIRYGVLAALGGTYSPEENYVYKLAENRPAAPAGAAYPPAGWSAASLEATESLHVWRSTQRVRGDVPGDWGDPELWHGTSHAYRLAADQPETPDDASFPPAGWSEAELQAADSMSAWRTSRTLTDGVPGPWGTPELWDQWLVLTFYRATRSATAPSYELSAVIAGTAGSWGTEPVYPTGRANRRWILQLGGSAHDLQVVNGFPRNDITQTRDYFGLLQPTANQPPPAPTTYTPPSQWRSYADGGLDQQTTQAMQGLYLARRDGYRGGTDAAGVTYDDHFAWGVSLFSSYQS